MNLNFKDKLLASFSNPVYNTLTVAQASARYHVASSTVTRAVRELRLEGNPIYTNRKTLDDGRKISYFRLGLPSKSYKRNLKAGRNALAIRALTG